MKKLLLVLIVLSVSIGTKAQLLQEVYQNDKILIKEYNGNNNDYNYYIRSILVDNYDSDEAIVYFSDSIRSIAFVDNNLEITNVINNIEVRPFMKLNNKLYGYYYSEDTTTNTYDFYLSIFDISNNQFVGHLINNGLRSRYSREFQKVILLENKELLFSFFLYPTDSYYLDTIKLIKVDTMGNIIATRSFNDSVEKIDIGYVGNKILYSMIKIVPDFETKRELYFLNEETLEKEDSISNCNTYNLTAINDSIFTFFGDRGFTLSNNYFVPTNNFYIVNENTKFIYSIVPTYFYGTYNIIMGWDENYICSPNVDIIDFVNPDSIYSMFYLRNIDDFNGFIGFGIINYNLSGDTNFVYTLSLIDSNVSISSHGIKATNDGGAILAMRYNSRLCLAKFMPNGLLSFLNIETGEKETIKVYPNPAKDFVYVDIEATNFEKGEIELFDMQGKLVKKALLCAKQGNRIDVSNLNAGAYTYNVSLNGKTISGKVIVGK